MTTNDLARQEQVLREIHAAILTARVRLTLLWLPAVLGLSWAKQCVLAQHDAIKEWEYTREEFSQNIRKLRLYGTTLAALYVFPDDGYDGWLQPEDRYQEQEGSGR
jgi:hypothetical protein